MKNFKNIFYCVFGILGFSMFLFFLGLSISQRHENFENYENGQMYFEQGEYDLALECFNSIGPNWRDNTEWIEKAQKAVDKENGICPYCGQNWE